MARDITTDLDASYTLTETDFLPADEAQVNAVIVAREHARNVQKGISRKMSVGALRSQIAAVGDAPVYGTVFADWRGRLNVHAAGLSYQGRETAKGCIMGKPVALGVDGLRELAFAVGTYWGNGVEKRSPAERVQWALDRLADGWLAKVVEEAQAQTSYEWRLADEATQFLAAAHDLVAANGNPAFESGVMVSKDATCSGLQIMGAMLGDVDTMLRVNVYPRADGKRADAYLDVGDECNAAAQAVADNMSDDDKTAARARWTDRATKVKDECWALYWAEHKVTRGVAKRPVMVKNYGGTQRAFSKYIREESGAPWKACMWLATLMDREVLPKLFPLVMEFMTWLQKVARILAKLGKPLAFTTTNGLPFVQAVPETASKRAEVNLSEWGRVQLRWEHDKPGTLDGHKQASGCVPNVVHSYDGLFLQDVLLAMRDAGLDTVATVHDCFAAPAAYSARMSEILADTFVETFGNDPVGFLFDQFQALAGDVALPPPPARAALDAEKVRASVYLFS